MLIQNSVLRIYDSEDFRECVRWSVWSSSKRRLDGIQGSVLAMFFYEDLSFAVLTVDFTMFGWGLKVEWLLAGFHIP